jgi:hypothetical protein
MTCLLKICPRGQRSLSIHRWYWFMAKSARSGRERVRNQKAIDIFFSCVTSSFSCHIAFYEVASRVRPNDFLEN